MDLYTVSELKSLESGDKVYIKYLELPASKEASKFDGACKVVVNNDEVLTTDEGINFEYNGVKDSNYACKVTDSFSMQIYKV